MVKTDFLVVGAGIIGLTIARELCQKKLGTVSVIEKEKTIGKHASGKNSGVLHAGVYYPATTLKAKVCRAGSLRMQEYAKEKKIKINRLGKVIVASSLAERETLDEIYTRAVGNGVSIKKITEKELRQIEPLAITHDCALHTMDTAVIDTHHVLSSLYQDLIDLGAKIYLGEKLTQINGNDALTDNRVIYFNHLINTAGLYADKIAHSMNVGNQYRILPFKGIYWKMSESLGKNIHGLIYPAPDLTMPFLGVHVTRDIMGMVTLGPTAIPALGRENYGILDGLNLTETPRMLKDLLVMYKANKQNFRKMVGEELGKYIPKLFLKECQKLLSNITQKDIGGIYKIGLRAQLINTKKNCLEMDFVVESGHCSTHVLNAVSPGFTGSFAFAKHVVDKIK